MQWTMNQNSLFAILLRSSFVWSFLIAGCMTAVMFAVIPEAYRAVASVSGLPFIVIGCMAAWRQLRAPSARASRAPPRPSAAMSWNEFRQALSEAYKREGYDVQPTEGAADLELRKEWRRTLVSCKRWKVGRTGVEPLRDLVKAKEAREAHECMYVAVGDISDNAREFAKKNGVALIGPCRARAHDSGKGDCARPRRRAGPRVRVVFDLVRATRRRPRSSPVRDRARRLAPVPRAGRLEVASARAHALTPGDNPSQDPNQQLALRIVPSRPATPQPPPASTREAPPSPAPLPRPRAVIPRPMTRPTPPVIATPAPAPAIVVAAGSAGAASRRGHAGAARARAADDAGPRVLHRAASTRARRDGRVAGERRQRQRAPRPRDRAESRVALDVDVRPGAAATAAARSRSGRLDYDDAQFTFYGWSKEINRQDVPGHRRAHAAATRTSASRSCARSSPSSATTSPATFAGTRCASRAT